MHAPGVEVRPLRQMTGEAEFNEVYFTDVRIPDAERLGDAGRRLAGVAHHADERAGVDRRRDRRRRARASIGEAASRCGSASQRTAQDAADRDELMQLWIRAEVLRLTNIRASAEPQGRRPRPGGLDRQGRRRPSSTRTSTTFAVDLLGAEGMLYGSYEMRRPRDGDGVATRCRRPSCAAGPTRSRAAPPR